MNEKIIGLRRIVMSIGRKYIAFVERVTARNEVDTGEDISFWREKLFTKFITYLLPTCLIALVPGVYMALKGGFLVIACCDMIAVCAIAIVSLNVNISLRFRKGFVVSILYMLSFALIVDLSLLGPGIVYLVALSVLITIIFPRRWGYWSIVANFLICIGCALIIHLKLFGSPLIKDYDLGTWIAVSSNLVFLSIVMVILVSNTIKGFEKVISNGQIANDDLQKELIKGVDINLLLTQSESHYKTLFFQNPSPMGFWITKRSISCRSMKRQ